MILFARNTQTNEVLIAYSEDPKKRLADLQRKCPARLEFVGQTYGDHEEKVEIHRAFNSYHVKGDWFQGEILHRVRGIIARNPVHGPPPLNVIIAGDSTFSDRGLVFRALAELHGRRPIGYVNISGSRPFECWTTEWAKQNKVAVGHFAPDYGGRGRAAVFMVGPRMLRAKMDAKILLAFVTETTSPSVASLIRQARKRGVEIVVVNGRAAVPV